MNFRDLQDTALEQLARKGAEVELAELEARCETLRKLLARGPHIAEAETNGAPVRKKRTMSAAARRAISRAQKRRWAALRTK